VTLRTASSDKASPGWSNRAAFLDSLRTAIASGRGFAAGKLGFSEQVWLASQCGPSPEGDPRLDRAMRASARFHACRQIGVFPDSDEYLKRCATSFASSMAELDFLAVHESPLVDLVVRPSASGPWLIGFNDLEPNRSAPYNGSDCYLPALRDLRVLLITSPAMLLAERATPETFAAVWERTGCPWFWPKSVTGLPFTSLFDSRVREEFSSSLEVLDRISENVSSLEFDVALVGAGSLGVPIVERVKRMGKVGISLGGHLQVLFGVQGRRWREDVQWQQAYWTPAWIDMPANVHSGGVRWLADDGAYW